MRSVAGKLLGKSQVIRLWQTLLFSLLTCFSSHLGKLFLEFLIKARLSRSALHVSSRDCFSKSHLTLQPAHILFFHYKYRILRNHLSLRALSDVQRHCHSFSSWFNSNIFSSFCLVS